MKRFRVLGTGEESFWLKKTLIRVFFFVFGRDHVSGV
jgi:hypothetical protein